MLTKYGRREWLTILIVGLFLSAAPILLGPPWWWIGVAPFIVMLALLSFFRDPPRRIPAGSGLMLSPSDGHISSIHDIEHYAPFNGPAVCVRTFLSVLDVHVNRSPCRCRIGAMTHKPGQYLNAMRPESAEVNESLTILLLNPDDGRVFAALRLVSGMIARRIVCPLSEGDVLEPGQRLGMIKFGSTTELIIPKQASPNVKVAIKQMVYGGATVLAEIDPGYAGLSSLET